MQTVSQAYLDAVRTGWTLATRLTVIDENDIELVELTGDDGYLLDADVLMSRLSLPRRTVSMTISNPEGIWTPSDLATDLWLQHRFKLQHGLIPPGSTTPEYVTLGTFIVDRPRVTFDDAEKKLSVQGSDYWRLGYRRKLRQVVTLARGLPLEDVVIQLAPLAGLPVERMRLDDSDRLLETQIVLPYGTEIMPELAKIVADYAHEVFCDYDGWLVLQPAPNGDNLPASVYSLAEGDDAILLSTTKDWSADNLYNAVVVVAEGAQRPTVSAEARDLNPDSPAYNPVDGSGPLGDRLLIEYTSRLLDEFACYVRAEALLFEHCMIEETYDLNLAPLAPLVPGDVVRLLHPESNTDDDLLIDTIRLGTLEADTQQLGIKKLRRLTA
jgi:hypothetical protein